MALGLLLAVYIVSLPLIRLELSLPLGRRVAFSDVALAALLAGAAATRAWRQPPARLLLAAMFPPLATALSAIGPDGPRLPALREVSRLIVPMVTLVALASLRFDSSQLRLAARAWTWTATTACLIGLAAFVAVVGFGNPAGALAQPNSPNLGPGVVRISGVLPTNALSLYLTTSVAFALFLLCNSRPPARGTRIALVLMIVTGFLLLSRGAIGLAIALSALAYQKDTPVWLARHRRSVVAATAALTVAGVFATLWAVFPVSLQRDAAGMTLIEPNFRPNAYRVLHAAGLRMFLAHPWLGIGPANFGPQFAAFTTPAERAGAWPPLSTSANYPPHSIWIGMLAEGGLVSLSTWLFLFATIGRELNPGAGQANLGTYLRLCSLGLLVNGLHVDLIHLRFIWAALGIGINNNISEDERS